MREIYLKYDEPAMDGVDLHSWEAEGGCLGAVPMDASAPAPEAAVRMIGLSHPISSDTLDVEYMRFDDDGCPPLP